jgi:hypothetical protein
VSKIYLHEHPEFKQLLSIVASEQGIDSPGLCEKDYWLMHVLHQLKNAGLNFELKGGTSLSKGYQAIHRFSEDIDIRIEPDESKTKFKVYYGKNQDDQKHRESRKRYFDWISEFLSDKIHGAVEVKRDLTFDDQDKFRNGGIQVVYSPFFPPVEGVRPFILLELGFDRTAPNQPLMISSWAYDRAATTSGADVVDNRAIDVACYEPKYTFVEKLQAIVKKYRQYKLGKQDTLPANFIRHYYDLYQLIERKDVQEFIGTDEYEKHKVERFKGEDLNISNSGALKLDVSDFKRFEFEYQRTAALYYRSRPQFREMMLKLGAWTERL